MTANEQREYRFRLSADLELVMATVEQLVAALTVEPPKPSKRNIRGMHTICLVVVCARGVTKSKTISEPCIGW
jgi:hypothetical protein